MTSSHTEGDALARVCAFLEAEGFKMLARDLRGGEVVSMDTREEVSDVPIALPGYVWNDAQNRLCVCLYWPTHAEMASVRSATRRPVWWL